MLKVKVNGKMNFVDWLHVGVHFAKSVRLLTHRSVYIFKEEKPLDSLIKNVITIVFNTLHTHISRIV